MPSKATPINPDPEISNPTLLALNECALNLLTVQDDSEICTVIANAVRKMIPDGMFIISWLSPDGKNLRLVEHHGFTPYLIEILDTLRIDPFTINFPLDKLTPEQLITYRSKRLNRYNQGLYSLVMDQIPQPVCRAIESITGIVQVYAMGFAVEEVHYGGIGIFVTRSMIESGSWNKDTILTIELIINFSSVLIKKNQDNKVLREHEKEIMLTEQKFSSALLINPLPMAIGAIDNGALLEVNDAFLKLTGFTREEIYGRTGKELDLFTMPWHRKEVYTRVEQQGCVRELEVQLKTKSGDILDGLFSADTIMVNKQKALLMVMNDITERKKAERDRNLHTDRIQALLELHNLHPNDFNNVMDYALKTIVKITGAKYSFLGMVNSDETSLHLSRWSKEVMESCNLFNQSHVLPISTGGLWAEAVRRRRPLLINDYSADIQEKKGIPHGHIHFRNLMSIPIFDRDKIVMIAVVADKNGDFTEEELISVITIASKAWEILRRHEIEEELVSKNIELVHLNDTKTKLFSIIAHDLKSPFNVVLGYSDLLATESDSYPVEQIKHLSRKLNQVARNCYRLLENLLEWSALQFDNHPSSMEVFHIRNVVEKEIDMLLSLAEQKNIKVYLDISDNPQISADINQFKSLCRNLATNALKFTPNNGKVIIRVQTALSGMEVIFSVIDNGIGIPPEMLDKLFKTGIDVSRKGTQGESSTGLGLLLCKEYVERMGGNIRAESVVGLGSSFFVTLPVHSG